MRKFHPLRITDLQPDAEDAVTLGLDVPPELRCEYAGLPGQHVVLRTELDGEETRRTYSLINIPGEWPLRIVARIHENGRMSRYLAQQMKVGDRIEVLPPNGSLTPRVPADGTARTYVGFAAGCGITPILSILKTILRANNADRFVLFYGNTSTGRVMCLETLLGLKDRYVDRLALHFLMSAEPQEVELYNGRMDGERVRQLARTLFEPASVTEFFVCGPGNMIEQVTGALRELSVSADRIHGEHFTVVPDYATVPAGYAVAGTDAADAAEMVPFGSTNAAEPQTPAAATQPRTTESQPPAETDSTEVTVLMDGRRRTFTMRMNDATVLDAAMRAGLDLPYSCRAGVCSTCRTKVVSGEVEMDQNYALEDWELEQGYVLACQSRVKTPTLELDYDEK
jgi:ring-1,2-phenylacetyl-CoA epoxidase subunit PaaE